MIWRLARAWDLKEEKILDLTLITFLGGFLGARVYFILENFTLFGFNILKWLLIHTYPGFSFWGALLGGYLTLYFFSRRFKINFWQAADIASVGLLGGLIFASLGCFLSGCSLGIPSKLFFAISFVGAVGKRIPVQLIEAALLFLSAVRIWKFATHFHIQGSVLAISLILIGALNLSLEPLRDVQKGIFLNVILMILGTTVFYKVTKRKILSDLKAFLNFLLRFIKDPNVRKTFIIHLRKSWYNYRVGINWKFRNLAKFLRKSNTLRRLNVRFSHKDSKYY